MDKFKNIFMVLTIYIAMVASLKIQFKFLDFFSLENVIVSIITLSMYIYFLYYIFKRKKDSVNMVIFLVIVALIILCTSSITVIADLWNNKDYKVVLIPIIIYLVVSIGLLYGSFNRLYIKNDKEKK